MEGLKIIAKNKINVLPETAGVYLFYGQKPVPIYIGKAINIRDRVKNHFSQPSYRDNLFINQVEKIGFIKTDSEIEALILEANLIKKYQPKYNVMWRDDKNYFYVAIAQNKNKILYVFITHQPSPQKSVRSDTFLGPFVEGTALKKTLRFLRRAFPYYTSKKHPKLKCTYCHLGLCPGPEPDLGEYKKNIEKLILILRGKKNAVLNSLKREMKQFSKENKFEEAGKIRDKIYNLQQVMAHASVIGVVEPPVQNLHDREFLAQRKKTQKILQGLLNLKKISRIECYDVSNIQGKFATGSMVVFIEGNPDKNKYRKFKIKIDGKPNDIAMLKEILQRRFKHPDWKFPEVILIDGGKAQLNVAVKSKIQMSNQIQNPKLKSIKVISLAKGRQELFIEGRDNPLLLKSLPREICNLILQLDNEAHRFAIAYHKKLRRKHLLW